MKKRGPIIGIFGVALIVASFAAATSLLPGSNPTMSGEMFLPNILEDMFDYISDDILIYPGESGVISYSTRASDVPLLWGFQITDNQVNQVSIKISNMFGDDLGQVVHDGPVYFDVFVIPKIDIYNFEITNQGNRPITIVMMFTEDPDNSSAFSDPNSPLMTALLPLAIAGIIMIIGIIATIIGGFVTVMDWKSNKNESQYY